MSHSFGRPRHWSARTILSSLQAGVEARKVCYQEAIIRRKYLHHDNWDAGWQRNNDLNYPTQCDIFAYKKPPATACSTIHHDSTDLPKLTEDLNDHGKFYGIARLELARRFPERAAKIFNWDSPGNNKFDYWTRAVGDLKELDLLKTNADFGLNIIVRLLYLYGEIPYGMSAPWTDADRIKWDKKRKRWTIPADPNFDIRVQERIKQALLRFKYWLDDDFRVIEEPKIWQARKGETAEGKANLVGGILGGVGGSLAGGLLLGPVGAIGGGVAGAVIGGSPNDPYADEKYEMEFFSENHQILFATAEYLVGQFYPEETFRPGENYRGKPKEEYTDLTGKQHMAKAKMRLDTWLDDRLRFGLSECNAPGYYDEHVIALLNLADFSLNESIRRRACMVLDLILYDLARFTHQGSFSVAAARAHFKHKNNGWGQSIGDLVEILFGTRGGVYVTPDSLAACAFASTRLYEVPDALISIGRDKPEQMIDRSRVSINFDEAGEYDIGFEKEKDVLRWWSRAAWLTKHVIDGTRKLVVKYGLSHTGVFKDVLPPLEIGAGALTGSKILGYVAAGPLFPLAIPLLGSPFSQTDEMADILSIVTEGSAYTRANLYTYRNQDVMLSSTQNHHAGQVSFQGNTCQATLSMCATVFTSHPSAGGGIDRSIPRTAGNFLGGLGGAAAGGLLGSMLGGPMGLAGSMFGMVKGSEAGGDALDKELHILPPSDDGPDWWTGNITQPRVVQMNNAAILAYKPKAFQLLLFGHRFHAWFPQDAFDDLPAGIKGKPPDNAEERQRRSDKYFPFQPSLNCKVESGRWVFGRVGKGYIGLFSGQEPHWTNDSTFAGHEIMVEAERNIFIIQVGNEQQFGSYEQFKERVLNARIHINGLNWKLSDFQCSYDIPDGTRLELHYDDNQVRYGGVQFSDDDFPRSENQYTQIGWLQNKYVIQHKGRSLIHDIKKQERTPGGLVSNLIHDVNLNIYAQNMGLFYIVAPYQGSEREQALQTLIDKLRVTKPDIVGLSEMWHEADRQKIREQLGEIYPYTLEGPDEFGSVRVATGILGAAAGAAAGLAVAGPGGAIVGGITGGIAGADAPLNGGLMFLSRHKIVASNATYYRHCAGEDCLSYKGMLHARVIVQGQPNAVDFFLSHTQNLVPKIDKKYAEEAVTQQLRHLGLFIQSCRDPRYPALLMGDLNVDAIHKPDLYDTMIEALGYPEDLEPRYHTPPDAPAPSNPSATSEHEKSGISSFNADNKDRPADDGARFGAAAERLDYFLSWNGNLCEPRYTNSRVLIYQSSPGRDLSDHYGITTNLASLTQYIPHTSRPIKFVRVRLARFYCLRTTSGIGDDEVKFTLQGIPGNGRQDEVTSRQFEEVSAGTVREIHARTLEFNDPGDFLMLNVIGQEIDDFSANDDLGSSQMRLSRAELVGMRNHPAQRMLPRLTGDGGEYAVEIEIEVEVE